MVFHALTLNNKWNCNNEGANNDHAGQSMSEISGIVNLTSKLKSSDLHSQFAFSVIVLVTLSVAATRVRLSAGPWCERHLREVVLHLVLPEVTIHKRLVF